MARFAVKTLEFDKVKNMLASKAATFLGKQAIISLQIESEFSKVKRLQEETAEALRILDEGRRFPFGGAFNITADVKRAELGSVLEPEELQHIQTTVQAFASMKDFTAENAETAPNLAEYGAELTQFSRLEKQIGSAIDEYGEIKDNASPKLGGLRTAIQIAKNRVKEKLDSILHDPNNQKYFMDNIVTMRGDRYVIPVKQEYKMNFPGIVHDQSGTGATLFIEPLAVVNLNNDIKRYVAEEHEEMERILRQLTQNVGAEAKALLASLEIFTTLDVICARALLAQEQHAVRPMLVLSGGVEIAQGRHPLLPKDTVVPLNVQLGDKFTMLLITGPNTGGKTVALKAVGLFALMAQIGLFIPASSAKMPVFRAVYADIGDEQSIEQSLSTFSAHMTNLISILNEVKAGDLVLIDEICAGTDPNEGAALAMAMLEHLHEQGVLTMVTTHYSELKTFAYGHEGMENASVEFDPVSLRPTYRLLMGVPGSSNAFNISRRLGLAEDIIKNAGELHLSVLIENMRREGYEFAVSKAEVLYKYDDRNRKLEPMELVYVDVPEEFAGSVIQKLSSRKGELQGIGTAGNGYSRLEFMIPSRGLIGYRGEFMTDTKGNGIMNAVFDGYEEYKGDIQYRKQGSLIAFESGETITYGLYNAQERGSLFIGPGEKVYAGMVIGQNGKSEDVEVNVCKKKQLTNTRASGSDDALRLVPPIEMSLEQCLEFIDTDELLEVTPEHLRIRKRIPDL